MTKMIYGDGKINTQRGAIEGEGKCLTITDTGVARPVGSTQKEWPATDPQDAHDVVLVFKTLESARTLQDEIGELCATWSREISPKT